MTEELRTLLHISISTACGDSAGLVRIGRSVSFQRASHRKITEAVLQVHLFAGFPATIEGFAVLSPYLSGNIRAKRGRSGSNAAKKKSLGLTVFKRIYKENTAAVLNGLCELHPALATWILEYGYGTVLNRKGLSMEEREVCAIGVLASLGWTKQLKSHMRGAMNLGISSNLIKESFDTGNRKNVIRKALMGT